MGIKKGHPAYAKHLQKCRELRERNREHYNAYNRKRYREKHGLPVDGIIKRTGECGPACKYFTECKIMLWAVRQDSSGLLYEPLRCFKEHPAYRKEEWVMR